MTAEEQAEVERLLKAIMDKRPQALDAYQVAKIGLTILAELRAFYERGHEMREIIRMVEREGIITQLRGIADKFEKNKATITPWGAIRNAALEIEEELKA